MASAAGPRVKRMRAVEQVQVNDVGEGMDIVTVSRLVRDLCRQQTLDRVSWQEAVNTFEDHAARLETMEDELLQVNDQTAEVFGRATAGQAAREAALTAHFNKSIADVTAAAQMIDTNLRVTVGEAHAEFQLHKDQSTSFAKTLEEKMLNLAANLEARFSVMEKVMGDAISRPRTRWQRRRVHTHHRPRQRRRVHTHHRPRQRLQRLQRQRQDG